MVATLRTKKTTQIFILIFLLLGAFLSSFKADAAIRKEFNYQGKLTDGAGTNVADGAYDVVFKIYTQAGGGAAVWTESWTNAALFTEATTTMTNDGCATGVDKVAYTTGTNESSLKAGQTLWNSTTKQSAVIESVVAASNYICIYDPQTAWTTGDQVTNRVYVKNGLFSSMVGSVTDLTVDFTADTYYLGVTIGTDSEMIPRKKIGSVPQAWNASNVVGTGYIDIDNTATTQDAANINYNPASGTYAALSLTYGSGGGTGDVLTLTQSGTGDIVDFFDGATSVFKIADGGNITMNALSFTQNAVNPVHKGAITDDTNSKLNGATGIYVQGKYAYVASVNDDGFNVIDISNPSSPVHISSIFTGQSDHRSVFVQGKYAYVTSRYTGVEIIDISNPYSVSVVGSISDDGTTELNGANSIYVQGKYAYVASYVDDGVEILDISNPAAPVHVGKFDDADNASAELDGAYAIYVQGKYAYVASYDDDGVEILDISNPASPTHVGAINDDGTAALNGAAAIYVSGRYAYVAGSADGEVEILDISNPASPTHVGVTSSASIFEPYGITVSGKYAYVTDLGDAVHIIDVSTPSSPSLAGTIADDGTTELDGAAGIFVQGKYAYIAAWVDSGMEVLDLSGFDLPTANIGDLSVSTIDVTDNANIANNLYVGNGLNVGPGGIYSSGEISAYVSSGNTALTIAQNGTGDIMDIKDGTTSVFKIADGGNITMNALSFTQNAVNPVHKGAITDAGSTELDSATSVFVRGKYAYIAANVDDGVEILDISNPAAPTHVGYFDDTGNASAELDGAISIFVSGQYAYVASYDDDGVEILDISNPAAPTHVGSITDDATTELNGARGIYVQGKYAYVAANDDDGVEILDISNPAAPTHVGAFDDASNASAELDGARDIYVQGKYAYVASYTDNGFEILDVSNPAAPTHIGSFDDSGNASAELGGARGLYISGKYAYIAGGVDDGVEILDISNPAAPTHVGSFDDSGNASAELDGAQSIYVAGKYAYVAANDDDGVEILDISNPAAPIHAGAITDDGTTELDGAISIYISGKYAYVASNVDDGLEVLEISGFDLPSANIGDLSVSTIDVTDNANIANNLYVGNGLNVGPGGIYSSGAVGIYTSSGSTALTVNQSGTGTLMDIMDTGVSIFKVGQATIEMTRPLDLQVEGDVGVEYNLNFLNNATSYINSAGPLTISAGDSNSYEHLTLTTSGTGDVIVDIASSTIGFKVIGLGGQVFSIDPSGNVIIGGVDTGDGNLTVKGNISTQGGNLDLNALATPSGVTVAAVGTAGSTTYGYRISAINDNGETLSATHSAFTTGNATLSSTNYNRVSWSAVPGATGYKVYGRTSGSELYMATVNSPTLYYNDIGTVVTPSGALPTTNTTGGNNITYAPADGPKRSIILTAAGAETPSTAGAAQTKVSGVNHAYYVLDFDAATDESAYWHWTMPDSYDGGKINITYYWEAASTSAEVGWCFQAVGIAPNAAEDIDSTLSSAVCEVDTAQGSANDLASAVETQATSNFAAGEYVAFKVFRDADQSTVGAGNDDMTGDARLVKVKIEYSVNAESD